MGNIDGSHSLTIGDIADLKIENGEIVLEPIPSRNIVRPELSKIRTMYFSFIGDEGAQYLMEYLATRLASGEKIMKDSPVIMPVEKQFIKNKNRYLMTTLPLRRIKGTIIKACYYWQTLRMCQKPDVFLTLFL